MEGKCNTNDPFFICGLEGLIDLFKVGVEGLLQLDELHLIKPKLPVSPQSKHKILESLFEILTALFSVLEVIEKGAYGGTCVNVGCVPKKVMWYTSQHAEFLHDHEAYGFAVGSKRFDWKIIKEKRDAYIKRLNGIYQTNLEKDSIKIIVTFF